MDVILEYWQLLVPLAAVSLALTTAALVHVLRHPNYHFGSRLLWIAVVTLVQFVGPIVYFVVGRGDE